MNGKNQKILVADDDSMVREMLADILESSEYQVELAEDGAQALQKCRADPDIKLVISDMIMPKMTGLELIKALSSEKFNAPIIILTGGSELSAAVEAINTGASDFLLKDENMMETLLPSVKKVLEKQEMEEALARKNKELEKFNVILEGTVKKLTEIATSLSSEKNFFKLLEMIVSLAREVTNSDGGTLYTFEDKNLHFMILQNKTMNTFMGGTTGNAITLPPVPLVESNVSAYCALKKEIINIPDVYDSESFDFSGTKKYDAKTGYRSKSMLVLPLMDRDNDVIGVLQLINCIDSITKKVVGFPHNQVKIVNSLACQAAICVENTRTYEKLEKKNLAFQRFVPSEFLRCLGKKEVEDISLGDSSHENMSVLFSDIRSFTNLSETMSPKESFRFLNGYLKLIAPRITKWGGFVDKFIGDAIMALFEGSKIGVADDAVSAAVEMQEEVNTYNGYRKKMGYQSISIGIGIHTGPLTLGTIGFETRVESTVVGDTVNLSSRLENLTKKYGILIAISSTTLKSMKKPSQFLFREIDTVQVKGKEKPVTIYEVFRDGPDNIKEKKILTLDRYNEALNLFKQHQWSEAYKLFSGLNGQLKTDKVILIYQERCRALMERPQDKPWNGITKLDEK